MTQEWDFLKLGIDLVNGKVSLEDYFKGWPTDRRVVLHICHPAREVEVAIPDWLPRFVRGEFKAEVVQTAIYQEMMSFYLETEPKYHIVLQREEVPEAKIRVYTTPNVFAGCATRSESIYSAYATGKPLEIVSKDQFMLTDLVHLDRLIELILDELLKQGIDLREVFR